MIEQEYIISSRELLQIEIVNCSEFSDFDSSDEISPTRFKISAAVLFFICLYICTTLPVFAYLHYKRVPHIKHRYPLFVYVTLLGQCFPLLFLASDLIGRETVSCLWVTFIPVFCIPFATLPHFIRITLFYFNRKRNQLAAKEKYFSALSNNQIIPNEVIEKEHHENLPLDLAFLQLMNSDVNSTLARRVNFSGFTGNVFKSVNSLKIMADEELSEPEEQAKSNQHERTESFFNNEPIPEVPTVSKTDGGPSEEYLKLAFLSSNEFGLMLMIPFLGISCIVFTIFSLDGRLECVGCKVSNGLNAINISLAGLCIVGCIIFLRKIRHEPDHFELKKEVQSALTLGVFLVVPYVPLQTLDPNNLDNKGLVNWIWIAIIGWTIYYHFSVADQVKKAILFRKDVLNLKLKSSNSPQLQDVLKSHFGATLFKAYIVEESSFENFLFYRDATIWKTVLGRKQNTIEGKRKALSLVKKIYSLYIKQWAVNQINISGSDRVKIYNEIEEIENKQKNGEEYHVPLHIFDEALLEVWQLMATDSFTRFKTSKYYEQYMGHQENLL
eukprot:snap_masked-scaffold_59-processed-gene-0.29-mRNA-1 protein AED:1.00 eAED:1.00 QI:0/0/0/0/1/1/3/0/554